MSEISRVDRYKKNKIVENVLAEVNKTLFSKELELIKEYRKPELPVIFIVGAQRSGTTILMQLITQLFNVAYPNNFIARYWNIPYSGAILYKSLEKNMINNDLDFSSDLGYTKGLEGPHEFGYFWKKWFPWESWEEKKYNKIDYSILQKQMAAWQSVDNKPLVFKNLIQLDYNIEKLYEVFPNSLFIFLERSLIYNVQSSYLSGIKIFGNENELFGVKPANYPDIKGLPVLERIVRQIVTINKDIEDQLAKIPEKKIIKIKYEDLVSDHLSYLNLISKKGNLKFKNIKTKISFISGNKIKIDIEKFNQIKELIKLLQK